MRKKLGLGVLLAVFAALLGLAPSASAYETVTNTRNQLFDTYPATNAKSCITRHITLARYQYDWESVMFGLTVGTDRTMNLVAGDYTWVDCIAYYSSGVYQHWSTLSTPGYPTATLTDVHYTFTDDPQNLPQYWAVWGSQLVPIKSW